MRDMKQLVDKLEVLESKLVIYSQNWGPDCDEVRMIQSQIDRISQIILDLMVAE